MKLKMLLTCISLSCGLVIASPVIAGNKRSKLIEEYKVMMEEGVGR
jgi:hypothetical protein